MIIRLLLSTALLLVSGYFSSTQAAPAFRFTKVLPFGEPDRLRVEVEIAAVQAAPKLELYGFIINANTGNILWQGSMGKTNMQPGQTVRLNPSVVAIRPELWDPNHPSLYYLRLNALRGGRTVGESKTRFGFRKMSIESGQFRLNERPIFLRGVAINPPGRTIPDQTGESRAFAEAYVRFLKSQNINIIRLSTDDSQTWFDVCDELGMLVYAGRYGVPHGAEEQKKSPPKDFEASLRDYRRQFEAYVRHPSVVVYYLANEMPTSGDTGQQFSKFFNQLHSEMRKWDSTRVYIANAGYGEGREGDVCDVHRYWGWYYNSFLTYYNLRDAVRHEPLFGVPGKNQPLTFTECVGAFTSSQGEFNVVRSKQLAPRLGWIGHTEHPGEDASAYQSFLLKQATESFRRMRPMNTRLAGIMPFTILFDHWNGITNFDQMKPKPAMAQLAISYQPVLLSWELWTPQVYAGSTINPVAHVVNDGDKGHKLKNAKLVYELRSPVKTIVGEGRELVLPDIDHFNTLSRSLPIQIPDDIASGCYTLCGTVVVEGKPVSTNWTTLFIADKTWRTENPAPARAITLYDPDGLTGRALNRNGIEFKRISKLADTRLRPIDTVLVIGENAWNGGLDGTLLRAFVADGGRVLLLQQTNGFNTAWLPAKISLLESSPNDPEYPPRSRPFREQMNVNPERLGHPVFRGLNRNHLSLWSDYTDWNQSKPGFPRIYPVTSGFKLENPEDLSHTAVLADYDRGLEGIALAEFFDGEGSVLVCGFDLVSRAGLDPAADRMLANLASYAASLEARCVYPLVEAPIRWGDFPSEAGTVCGSLNGLLVNAEWVCPPTNARAEPLPANTGAWNMKPGDQFLPRGRNPFGEYSYSTASGLRVADKASTQGSGFFWATLPEGRKRMLTLVRNPGTNASSLTIAFNNQPAAQTLEIPAGKTFQLKTPLPSDSAHIRVSYSGSRDLVLLETKFE